MIVVMNPKASEREVRKVLTRLKSQGYETHVSKLNGRNVIVANGIN